MSEKQSYELERAYRASCYGYTVLDVIEEDNVILLHDYNYNKCTVSFTQDLDAFENMLAMKHVVYLSVNE